MRYAEAAAVLSRCGRYRYTLTRVWDPTKPLACVIMLNPSTADGRKDDPTIRSLVRLLSALGFGGFTVVNLFAWRATDPHDLPSNPATARGAENARAISTATSIGTVICAWGASDRAARAAGGVLDIVALHKNTAYCFGRTKSGAPRHPLYVRTGTELEVYWRRCA